MSAPVAYRFADLTLDVGRRRLQRGSESIALGRLTYALLVALVECAPNVLTHDELVRRVWGGRSTSPETVTQRVKLLRDALHDDAVQPTYVGLVRGQGYRLIPPVERLTEPNAPAREHARDANTRAFASKHAAADEPPRPTATRSRVSRGRLASVSALLAAAAASLVWSHFEHPSSEPGGASIPLDFEITQLTSSGRDLMPAITPDGEFVVYARTDGSLWVRQIGTTREVQIVAPDPTSIASAPTVSPDGRFVDFIRTSPAGRDLWRVPFLGGAPRRLRENVSSPIGWSPDGKQGAFVAYGNEFRNTSLVSMSDDAPDRVLATRTAPAYFVSLNIVGDPPARPAWSPDGRLVALPEYEDLLAPRIAFIDTATGEETSIDSQGSFVPQGLGWLGPATLVLSEPEAFGQRIQLWRMSYPDGSIVPLTNDLASYIGVDLDASRTRLVTTRREIRASIWLADSSGSKATQLVPPTPFGTPRVFLSWAGDRLFYDTTFGGNAAIAAIVPGRGAPEQIVTDAFYVAAAPDGSAIVFSGATRGREGLWRTDASGQQPVQLVSGFAVEPVVTSDRRVVYVSTRGGVVSPWTVPLDGGEATEIVGDGVNSIDVSPDGRRIAYSLVSTPLGGFVVCDLPDCSNRLALREPRCIPTALRFTPDARALACAVLGDQNIWAVPLDGGAPYQVTHFDPDSSRIVRFAWSSDGRLAFVRSTTTTDVVLLSGLHP